MPEPSDTPITHFLRHEAPDELRRAVEAAGKRDVVTPAFPYDRWMDEAAYDKRMDVLQLELVKAQNWVARTGARVLVIFEGRDGAGKGGAIRRMTANLDAKAAPVTALEKPTETERGQWYFQRYVARLPAAGQIAIFDRSWYNRAVVEHVFGWCEPEQREAFFAQLPDVEKLLVHDGIVLVKLWLTVGRGEQLRRMLERERDPLKNWKLSDIDVNGLRRWDQFTDAIGETMERTHFDHAPWTVVRADDKKRARLGAIAAVLQRIAYDGRDDAVIATDPKIVGGRDLWLAGT